MQIKDVKNHQKFAIWAPSHNFVGPYIATKARIDNWKKPVKQQYLPRMSSQYGELRPTSGWDRSGSLRHSSRASKFQGVLRLGSVTAAMSLNGSQPNFARCLAVSWAGTLQIHFRGFLPHYGILPHAKFTLHPPSLVLSHFGSVTAQHLRSGREPNFAELSTGRHLYSAGWRSRWALAHFLVWPTFSKIQEL